VDRDRPPQLFGCLKALQHVRHGGAGFSPHGFAQEGAQILRAEAEAARRAAEIAWKTDALHGRGRAWRPDNSNSPKSSSPLSPPGIDTVAEPIAAPSSCPQERLPRGEATTSASQPGQFMKGARTPRPRSRLAPIVG